MSILHVFKRQARGRLLGCCWGKALIAERFHKVYQLVNFIAG